MTLMFDGWDSTNRDDVVNVLCVWKDSAIFLDSVLVGEENRTSQVQAEAVEKILEPYESVKAFAALVATAPPPA